MVGGTLISLSSMYSRPPLFQSLGLLSFLLYLFGDAAVMLRYDLDLAMEHNLYLHL